MINAVFMRVAIFGFSSIRTDKEGAVSLGGGGHSEQSCLNKCLKSPTCKFALFARSTGYCHLFKTCKKEGGNAEAIWTRFMKVEATIQYKGPFVIGVNDTVPAYGRSDSWPKGGAGYQDWRNVQAQCWSTVSSLSAESIVWTGCSNARKNGETDDKAGMCESKEQIQNEYAALVNELCRPGCLDCSGPGTALLQSNSTEIDEDPTDDLLQQLMLEQVSSSSTSGWNCG